ncbi:MAG: pyruvate kinase [Pseudomonadota bacterium]
MQFRKTKIISTLGPATASDSAIRGLIRAGMDVARLNFSHGDRETHRGTIRTVRRLAEESGRPVGILQDLGGPKIRLGKLPGEVRKLEAGETIMLAPVEAADELSIPVNYPYIVEDVSEGDRILLADGLVLLEVKSKEKKRVMCEVQVGGVIQSHKGLSLPSSSLRVPAFTDKDRGDLKLGLEEGVDFVALSFVRHEKDLEPVREMLVTSKNPPLCIAKIEKPQAVDRLEEILVQVDGLMVARGDLGVEMPLEQVPVIQKKIIRMARRAGKPVITATQMLRSMVDNPRPTRAEAADVANAVLDGTDAVMLSEETAIGEYPVEAVEMLDRIIRATEPHLQERLFADDSYTDPSPKTEWAIGRSACFLAEDLQASAIIACTSSGSTARLVARFRPVCPLLGLTPNRLTKRQLTLSWGVIPAIVTDFKDTDEFFELAGSWALEHRFVEPGGRLIVTAGVPVGKAGTTNLLKVIEI